MKEKSKPKSKDRRIRPRKRDLEALRELLGTAQVPLPPKISNFILFKKHL